MYLLLCIERMGTGTVDTIRRRAEAGLPEPEFEAGPGFLTRIWRKAETTERTERTTPKTVPERILALLTADPRMTQKQLPERVGLTLDGIKYHMRHLKASGAIVRVGSSRAGHWQVVEPGIPGSASEQPENNQKSTPPTPVASAVTAPVATPMTAVVRPCGRRVPTPLDCVHGASPLPAARFVSAPVAQPG